MGRDQYTEPVTREVTIVDQSGTQYRVAELLDNVQITVWKLNADGTRQAVAANLFNDRSSAAPFGSGNPMVTANGGKTNFWADGGEYELDFHDLNVPVRIGDQTLGWQAHGGNEGGITATQLPNRGEALAPAGSILPYAGNVEPAGWLFADGRVVNRGDYPNLFNAVGTLYQVGGEPGTQFRLPDYRGRSLLFADDLGGSGAQGAAGRLSSLAAGARVRGQSGGSDAVVLAAGHLPPHSHPVIDPGHGHTVSDPGHSHTLPHGSGVGTYWKNDMSADFFDRGSSSSSTGVSVGTNATGITVGNNTGGGGAHQNLSPYQICHVIIKT